MEAVPKLPLLSFELKVSSENTDFGPKLKQYIADAYREDPESYSNEIHQLEGLRSAAVRATSDAAGLSHLIRYFCQLRAMQSRFPMAKGQPAACSFSWRDIYAGVSCSLSDVKFEMASILYNIGALHTQLGSSEPRTTAESLKAACTHYQHAAWAFECVREQYPQAPGVDVSTDIMKMMQEICFAQAQECILEKSIQDTRKPSVVGAVATQVLYFYRNSLALLGPSAGSDTIHEIIGSRLYNYTYRYLSFKTSYIGCIVCLYQGMHAEEQQKMGERVTFYQQAIEKLTEARKLSKYIEPVQVTQEALTFTNDVVEGKRKAAKNENEFIYHEEVPDKNLLIDLKPVCLVKALSINLNDPEVSGPDLFSRLVPMGAHEVSSLYSEEKAKLLRQIVSQAEAKSTELTEFMSSLQLDQLDVLDSEQKIPQEIVDRCAAMNAKTEIIQSLVDSMNNLAETISEVEHSLAEIKNLIQEETMKEKEYQKVMGPRPPSIVQTELSREYHKYQEAHTRTNESNQVLHKAMTLHIANLKLLAQPLDALHDKIPSIDNIEGLDRDTMKEMRRVVGKAREMQTQRDLLVQQLRDAVTADDITAKLLARSSEPTEEIFKQELEKHAPKLKIIEQNLAAQENIINKLTSLYASYGESRRLLTDVLRKRDGLINALITSYDTYEELLGKSQKGQEFYKKLSHNVNQLLARLRSTCQVQEEERSQHLAKQTTKVPTPSSTPPLTKTPEIPIVPPPSGGSRKLKDYLPYMKNRTVPRSVTPQAQIEPMPNDNYYPETIYPTSVRPAPVGSEATEVTQMQLPDGVVMPTMHSNHYDRYTHIPYAPTESDPYQNYTHTGISKAYDKPALDDINYGYNTPYIPTQYGSQQLDQQIYSNPYYSVSHENPTGVSNSQNPMSYAGNINTNTATHYPAYNDPYTQNIHSVPSAQAVPNQEVSTYNVASQSDLNVNFAQMHVSAPKTAPNYGVDYTHTYHNVQYPQSSTTNVVSYAPNSMSNVPAAQTTTDYTTMNYPYNNEPAQQYGQSNPIYNPQEPQYSTYVTSSMAQPSQSYPTYTNADSTGSVTTSTINTAASTAYNFTADNQNYNNPALSQLDTFDQPIKSHVTGQALATNYTPYQGYDANVPTYSNPTDNDYQPANTYTNTDQKNSNYPQNYQNHPGYMFNTATGNYDYNYGSQNSYNNTSIQGAVDSQMTGKDGNWVGQLYTNAGMCETMQSPSEGVSALPQITPEQQANNTVYYNTPYGYLTASNQPPTVIPKTEPPQSTNYGANVNQSTYMQSGQDQNTSVTYTNNQVLSHKENVTESSNLEPNSTHTITYNPESTTQNTTQVTEQNVIEEKKEEAVEKPTEKVPVENAPASPKPEPSVFDLLSDIDFTVEQKPLMPEITVPQISENVIKKPIMMPKVEPVKLPPKEEVIERPAKRDLFSDPILLNKFTQEVKSLQKLVDSLTNKMPGGLTLLDSKWKNYQDVHAKENMKRSKTVALHHTSGNIIAEVVPFDDSRLTLKSDPDAYINASYYKQLAPWCIPIIISKNPKEGEYQVFWRAILENKISCVVCLLSEIEIQGKSYFPTAKGQSLELSGGLKVVLEDVTCTVHWTERKLTVSSGKTVINVTHYQINVFPAKIVCSPLVLLADRVLGETFEGRLSNQLCGACIQCGAGAGRSAILTLLVMLMCQVRAGQIDLCDMLDAACINLYKHRSNVLEDTKYLADAYRTALFYVQGVLCSGTTMFNGEAVSVQTGASVLPPVTPNPSPNAPSTTRGKFSRESFEEMKQSPGLKSGDMKDPLNFLDPLWSLKKK